MYQMTQEQRDWMVRIAQDKISIAKAAAKGTWEEKKKFVQMLTCYNQLKRGFDESIKNFSSRFNTIYNSLPADCKPPEGMTKLHFAEAFDDDFSLFLRERRSPTLAQMMFYTIEVEINMMSSKRGRYKVDTRE